MIDKSFIGLVLPASRWEIEKGRVRAFARAIGDTRPECNDEEAAKALGYPSLLAPPTFAFSAMMDARSLTGALELMNVPIARILHGEQSFDYQGPIFAGDVLSVETRVSDIIEKKNGAMEFVTQLTTLTNQNGEQVGELRTVLVVRNK
ncbi:MaoC family dehydratase N-terminal domain-containing protein [Pseudomonas jinjuensis]|uniref:Acyl dehydratase n=1 Tax=Pseudomonas jinjuensis TaxID=198616 RepID=A0A1H0E9P8_9PSED|nr:MaoC family dehydratase N-terminal domain-containing protein [Pseudomonas jinjuensis]SDN79090.1 Acyl dehydratase [Pseudomonas jinjuensis]